MPNSFGNWLATIRIPDPNTYPARMGREKKSAIRPRRRKPPMSSIAPTKMLSIAAMAMYSSDPIAARGARIVATMIATVDSGPTLSSLLEPHIQ